MLAKDYLLLGKEVEVAVARFIPVLHRERQAQGCFSIGRPWACGVFFIRNRNFLNASMLRDMKSDYICLVEAWVEAGYTKWGYV
ncbi:MAG: hypothetical protein H6577_10720 [Lewinellaceae bacterium]|nr:hypothetical protein [Saprospiraceae bacterium]MCB9338586.1 hypothetical protein [Lewinellaceae bacterium]